MGCRMAITVGSTAITPLRAGSPSRVYPKVGLLSGVPAVAALYDVASMRNLAPVLQGAGGRLQLPDDDPRAVFDDPVFRLPRNPGLLLDPAYLGSVLIVHAHLLAQCPLAPPVRCAFLVDLQFGVWLPASFKGDGHLGHIELVIDAHHRDTHPVRNGSATIRGHTVIPLQLHACFAQQLLD